MRPGALLPDPVWNLVLVCWMDLQTIGVVSWQDNTTLKWALKNERGNRMARFPKP